MYITFRTCVLTYKKGMKRRGGSAAKGEKDRNKRRKRRRRSDANTFQSFLR